MATLEKLDTKMDSIMIRQEDVKKQVTSLSGKIDEAIPRIVGIETKLNANIENTKMRFSIIDDKVNTIDKDVKGHPEKVRGYIHRTVMIFLGTIGMVGGVITLIINVLAKIK